MLFLLYFDDHCRCVIYKQHGNISNARQLPEMTSVYLNLYHRCLSCVIDVIRIKTLHLQLSINAMDPLAWNPFGVLSGTSVVVMTCGPGIKEGNMFTKSIGCETNASFLSSIKFA